MAMIKKEHDPHAAVDYIFANAPAYAQAKANRVYLEEFRKSKKALLMNESTETAANAREQYAYSSPDYISVIDGLKAAVAMEIELQWKLKAAELAVDVWRTEQANNRGVERVTR